MKGRCIGGGVDGCEVGRQTLGVAGTVRGHSHGLQLLGFVGRQAARKVGQGIHEDLRNKDAEPGDSQQGGNP
ncbi:MAG: hypothetical protein BGO39_13365 [Chloroflexi bacterium 54-19]|nr:MAG: hypothetical protein BGO39_13365 [Chloroflexi bacterium 54-19]